jgi:hypothetical protein
VLLAPLSVAQSKSSKRHKIVACRALPLKNETLFPLPLFTIILGKSKVSAPIVFATYHLPLATMR